MFKEMLRDKFLYKNVPHIEMAIYRSNIDQFLRLKTFLKSEFCGLHKNVQNFYPRVLGGPEIAKNKVTKVLMDTLYIFLAGNSISYNVDEGTVGCLAGLVYIYYSIFTTVGYIGGRGV